MGDADGDGEAQSAITEPPPTTNQVEVSSDPPANRPDEEELREGVRKAMAVISSLTVNSLSSVRRKLLFSV